MSLIRRLEPKSRSASSMGSRNGSLPASYASRITIPRRRGCAVSSIWRHAGSGLAPGQLILWKPAARIVDYHLMRQAPAPIPQNQIVIGRCDAMGETRDDDPGVALV